MRPYGQSKLHELVAKQQPNICQIVFYRAGEKVYSDCWNNYKADDCVHIIAFVLLFCCTLICVRPKTTC